MKQLAKYPFVLLMALIMVIVSIADVIVSKRPFSELENRPLKQRPPINWDSLISLEPSTKFSNLYETYINDQFVGRDMWINLKSLSETALGKMENNGIIYGDDGFQFAKEQSYDWWRADINIQALTAFVNTVDIPVDFGLIPASYEVYRELLPKGVGNVNQKEIIQKIYAQLPQKLHTLDVEGALLSHKDEQLLYYRNDHHWTTNGAYFAYADYVRSIGLEPVPQSQLQNYAKIVPNFYGTHSNKSKLVTAVPDEILYYDLPMESVTVNGDPKPTINNDALWSAHNKYAAFLWDNNGHTILKRENQSAEQPSRILLVKDSFSNCLAPFLSLHFDEVHIVDLRYLPTTVQSMLRDIDFDRVLVLYGASTFGSDTYFMRMEQP